MNRGGYEQPAFQIWQGMDMPGMQMGMQEGYVVPGMMPQMMQPVQQLQRSNSGSNKTPEQEIETRKRDEQLR